MSSRTVKGPPVAIAPLAILPPAFALLAFALLAIAVPAPARADDLSPQKLMQFGAEAAKDGLWREAILRWERALKTAPANARLLNNLAVAYESAGRFDDADRAYREARRIDPERKSIRENHESFLKLHPQFIETPPAGAAATGDAPHAP